MCMLVGEWMTAIVFLKGYYILEQKKNIPYFQIRIDGNYSLVNINSGAIFS